jgi:hypothetical protein
MATNETLVAIFDTRGQAEAAIDELWHAGFREEQIGIAAPGAPSQQATTPTGEIEKTGARGAVAGTVTGGTVGGILGGIAVGLIPGIGQVMAGGILAGIVTGIVGGAAAGAAAGAYAGPFLALGFSEEEARSYQQHLRLGRTIVTVKPEGEEEQAITIVKSHGGRMAQPGKPVPEKDSSTVAP